MPKALKANEFVCLTGIDCKKRVSGKQVARMFGFDPDKCSARVDRKGNLTLVQKEYDTTYTANPELWAKVICSNRKKKATKPLTLRVTPKKRKKNSRKSSK